MCTITCASSSVTSASATRRGYDRASTRDAPKSAEELALEEIISDLAYRRKHADGDSAEYKMIMRQMAGIRREGYLAARILEEYYYWG